MSIYGIDTNQYHPITNMYAVRNWLRRKNSGNSPGFLIARLGFSAQNGRGGLVLDLEAEQTLSLCNQLNIPCGAYVYCNDVTPQAAERTMQQAMQVIRKYRLEYPMVYDMEYGMAGEPGDVYQYDNPANVQNNTEILRAAMQTVEQAGYYAMIYSSRDFFLQYTNLNELKAYDKWEAAYTATDNDQIENGIWQYSDEGSVPGIEGAVDLDLSYKDYPAIMRAAGLNGFGPLPPPQTTYYSVSVNCITAGDYEAVRAAVQPVVEARQLEPYYHAGPDFNCGFSKAGK